MASNWAYLPLVSSPVATKRYTSPTRVMVRPSPGLRIVGFIWLSLLSLCWQLRNELYRPLNPATQFIVAFDAFRVNQRLSLHRPPRNVELPDVWLLQRFVAVLWAEPDDQRLLPDPDEHVAIASHASGEET